MKVKIISGNHQYNDLFTSFGHTLVDSIQEADLVCFTGGEDVSPAFYEAEKHKFTYNNTERDREEYHIFQAVETLKKPVVGICRGGQFLNVMSGGEMYQHVTKHTTDHYINTLDGNMIEATSTHHQMFKPATGAFVMAVADQMGTREWWDKENKKFSLETSPIDYEVVYYPNTKCLCFQPHPEFGSKELQEYFFKCINKCFDL